MNGKSFRAKIKDPKNPHYGEWGEATFHRSGCQADLYKIVLDSGEELEVTDHEIRRSFLDNTDANGLMSFCIGPIAFRVKDFRDPRQPGPLTSGESMWFPVVKGVYRRRK